MSRGILNFAAMVLGLWLGSIGIAARAGDSLPASKAPSNDAGKSIFNAQVREIVVGKCLSCHGPDQKKGKLDLSTRDAALRGGESGEAALVPGKPEESLLVEKLTAGEMPPKNPLTPEQINAVQEWISAGGAYDGEPLKARRAGRDWWSLRPIRHVDPPAVSARVSLWARNPIDLFLGAELEKKGLGPNPEADRRTLIRRVMFDLIGLPPTPDEIEAFESDNRPDAFERLVDRLLGSPHHGERWGRHWLDVVRFGESHGYETNMPRPNAWPYRDYVIRAFNRDLPYSRFVFEQIAGDTRGGPSGSSGIGDQKEVADWLAQSATGFLVGGTHDEVGNAQPEAKLQQRVEDLDDMITATGTAFLGLTVNCARCHDHKFDPITQKDYYGLQAIFAGVNHADRAVPAPDAEAREKQAVVVALELSQIERKLDESEPFAAIGSDAPGRPRVDPHRNVERFSPISAKGFRLTILATTDKTEPCIDEIEAFTTEPVPRNVAAASNGAKAWASSEFPGATIHKIVHLNDGRVGNDRSWISRSAGKGMVAVEWLAPAMIDRVVWGRDRNDRYRDRLASEYILEVKQPSGDWKIVASSLDRLPWGTDGKSETSVVAKERVDLLKRQAELRERLEALKPTMNVYAAKFSQPGMTHVLRRGDPTQPGASVVPAGIASLSPPLVLDHQAPESERRVALARWIADPRNPLPARVMVNRLWHYHFGQGLVSTPSDFGFNGGPPSNPELLEWLATLFLTNNGQLKPLHRLIVTSATYRQSSLANSKAQAIDKQNRLLWRMAPRRLEAESIRDSILACSGQLDTRMGGPGYNIWEKNTNYVAVYQPRVDLEADAFRRMVYQFKPRSQLDPTFGTFDCPDAGLVAPRRTVSTTALQSLSLFNSRFIVRQAKFFAKRLESEAGTEPAKQIKLAFSLTLGRSPTVAEQKAATILLNQHGLESLCRALFNANEFLFAP